MCCHYTTAVDSLFNAKLFLEIAQYTRNQTTDTVNSYTFVHIHRRRVLWAGVAQASSTPLFYKYVPVRMCTVLYSSVLFIL